MAGRRVGTALLVAFVVAGVVGLLGYRESTSQAGANGAHLAVDHPGVVRVGQEARTRISLTNDRWWPEEVTIGVLTEHLAMFDAPQWSPEPVEQRRDGEWTYLTFAVERTSTLVVDVSAPAGSGGGVTVPGSVRLAAPDIPPIQVDFQTLVLP